MLRDGTFRHNKEKNKRAREGALLYRTTMSGAILRPQRIEDADRLIFLAGTQFSWPALSLLGRRSRASTVDPTKESARRDAR